MCGIDSCGEMRTFIDTCDMHEFNCDSKKDFKQRPIHECWVTCKRGRSFKKPEYRTDCNINLTEECNIADICRHDQVAVCGLDSCGEMRTFIDT
ncbi:putative extracellular nuclease, partial [Operophtera brumata]